jgi:hypothetical protein
MLSKRRFVTNAIQATNWVLMELNAWPKKFVNKKEKETLKTIIANVLKDKNGEKSQM